jgi:hypothetical protein
LEVSVQFLGEIVGLQVQTASLKVGEAPRRRYDPAPIRAVPAIRLDTGGVTGLTDWGEDVEDVHHRDHPASKHRAGTNGVSVLFTGHYGAMRERFGQHLTDGIAGENILVAHDRIVTGHEQAAGLVIETSGGQRVRLTRLHVAAPCVEFSRYALRFPDDERPDRSVTEAVQFLDSGLRGFYAAYEGPPVAISLGDKVYLAG